MHRTVGWLAALAASRGERPGGRARSWPGRRRLTTSSAHAQGLYRQGVRHDARSRTPARARSAPSTKASHYIPGRVLVKWQEGMPTAAKMSSISGAQRRAPDATPTPYADFELVEIAPDVDPEAAAAALAAQPGVEYAEPDGLRYVSFRPNDPSYSRQWNMPAINMETAWDINQGGDSTSIVAVLDTGVAYKTDVYRLQRYDGRTLRTVDVPVAAAHRSRDRQPLRRAASISSGAITSRPTSTATARTSPARSASRRTTTRA